LCFKPGVHKKTLLLLLAFAILFDSTGCVSMSAQARRERAYRHYVAKQMKQRRKAIARAQKVANRDMKRKMKNLQPSEPKVTTSLEDAGLEAASPPVPAPQPAPEFREPTVDPITVSASSEIPSEPAPQQP